MQDRYGNGEALVQMVLRTGIWAGPAVVAAEEGGPGRPQNNGES